MILARRLRSQDHAVLPEKSPGHAALRPATGRSRLLYQLLTPWWAVGLSFVRGRSS